MPFKAPRPCSAQQCPNLAEPGGRYCAEHRRERVAEYNAQRGSAASRGYDARWRKLRLMQLKSFPVCADPFGIHKQQHAIVAATDVDHIVAKRDGGEDTLENLQSLCHACHSRKTAQDTRWGRGG